MKTNNNKQIYLSLITMGILIGGTEIITTFISKGSLNHTSTRFWFAFSTVLIYFVFALQFSKKIKK